MPAAGNAQGDCIVSRVGASSSQPGQARTKLPPDVRHTARLRTWRTVISKLFTPLKLRDIEFPNRLFLAPMCQYSVEDGVPGDWHMVHLGSRAVGGAGLVMAEATSVTPEGRISPFDLGLWDDGQAAAFAPITSFIKAQGSVATVQLAHAGRKACRDQPWRGGGYVGPEDGGWQPVAPSPAPFDEDWAMPRQLSADDIDALVAGWRDAARRSLEAGFEVIELHFAHGYLAHQFLSPISNHRQDEYGGSLENRARFPLRVLQAVREVWPERLPLLVRISATDWVDGGWDVPEAVQFCRWLKEGGVDLIDCSSGGMSPHQRIDMQPGYQVPFADTVRREAGIPTSAVGLITEPEQAEEILAAGKADAIFLGRELLRRPYWPLHAAIALGDDTPWPNQYLRGKPAPAAV